MDSFSSRSDLYITACNHLFVNYKWGNLMFDRVSNDLDLNPVQLRLIWSVSYASRRAQHTFVAGAATRAAQERIFRYVKTHNRDVTCLETINEFVAQAKFTLSDAALMGLERRQHVNRLLDGRLHQGNLANKYCFEDFEDTIDKEDIQAQFGDEINDICIKEKVDVEKIRVVISAIAELVKEFEIPSSAVKPITKGLIQRLIRQGLLDRGSEEEIMDVDEGGNSKQERKGHSEPGSGIEPKNNKFDPKNVLTCLPTRMALYRSEACRWQNTTDNPTRTSGRRNELMKILRENNSLDLHPFTLNTIGSCYIDEDDIAKDEYCLHQFGELLKGKRIQLIDLFHWRQVKELHKWMIEPNWDTCQHLISKFRTAKSVLHASKEEIRLKIMIGWDSEKIMTMLHGNCRTIVKILENHVRYPYVCGHLYVAKLGGLDGCVKASFKQFMNIGSDKCDLLYLSPDDRIQAYRQLHTTDNIGDRKVKDEFEASWFLYESICGMNIECDAATLCAKLLDEREKGWKVLGCIERDEIEMIREVDIHIEDSMRERLVYVVRRYLSLHCMQR